jgi:hypothetical protein
VCLNGLNCALATAAAEKICSAVVSVLVLQSADRESKVLFFCLSDIFLSFKLSRKPKAFGKHSKIKSPKHPAMADTDGNTVLANALKEQVGQP